MGVLLLLMLPMLMLPLLLRLVLEHVCKAREAERRALSLSVCVLRLMLVCPCLWGCLQGVDVASLPQRQWGLP